MFILGFFALTLYALTAQNGQTHSNNVSAVAFRGVGVERVQRKSTKNNIRGIVLSSLLQIAFCGPPLPFFLRYSLIPQRCVKNPVKHLR